MMVNSSPPRRATVSLYLTQFLRRCAVSFNKRSPASTQRIVDLLEAIQVKKDQRDRMPIALGFSDVLAQTIHEQYAIGQAGKRIIMCKLEYLRFGILAITDIGMDADHAQRLAGFIRFHQLAAAQRPLPAAILATQAELDRKSKRLNSS